MPDVVIDDEVDEMLDSTISARAFRLYLILRATVGGVCTRRELADRVGSSLSTIDRAVAELYRTGRVVRGPDGPMLCVLSKRDERAFHERARAMYALREALPPLPPRLVCEPVGRQPGAQHARVHTLADRDGWDCYLCGEPLVDVCAHGDTLDRVLHRWLAVVEHVVPKALGGSSRLENLRLACWPCNARKGAQ